MSTTSAKRDRDSEGRKDSSAKRAKDAFVSHDEFRNAVKAFWGSSDIVSSVTECVDAIDMDAVAEYVKELCRALAKASWDRFRERRDEMAGSQCYATAQFLITRARQADSALYAPEFGPRMRWVLQNAMLLEALVWHHGWKAVPDVISPEWFRKFLKAEGWATREDAVTTFACIVSTIVHERFRRESPGFLYLPDVEHAHAT